MNTKKFYDATAANYDERHGNATTKYMRETEEKVIRKYASGRILDVGCGTNPRGIGLDISLEMLKRASGMRIQGRAEYLPFKKESFDTVLCMFTTLNMCDIERAVKDASFVLRKNGLTIVSVSSVWDGADTNYFKKIFANKIKKSKRKKMRAEGYRINFHLFSKAELEELFSRNGMRMIYFKGIYKIQRPYWGWFRDFTIFDRLKLASGALLPEATGRMYFAVFRKV